MEEHIQTKLEQIKWYIALPMFIFAPWSWLVFLLKKKKWTSTTKWTFVLLGIFWPVGLYFLFKKAEQFTKGAKIAIVSYCFMAVVFIISMIGLAIILNNAELANKREKELNAETLFGSRKGPLAIRTSESSQKDMFKLDNDELDEVIEIVDMMDIDSSQALNMLYEYKQPPYDYRFLKSYHCILALDVLETDIAYDICEDYWDSNTDDVIALDKMLRASMYAQRCERVEYAIEKLVGLRFGNDFTQEEKTTFAGNASIYAIECDVINSNVIGLLDYAIENETIEEDKQIYREYRLELGE